MTTKYNFVQKLEKKTLKTKQTSGLKRQTIDKFYTSPETVKMCLNLVKKHINIDKLDLCIEPSAGNGSFISGIKSLFEYFMFYDLKPENREISQLDYLMWEHNVLDRKRYNKVHVIGNPPFGRQSSLATKFIKKSSEFCDTISFILPKSFKKDSLQRRVPLHFHLVCNQDLPENSFLLNGQRYDVPCVFQIWIKQKTMRKLPDKQKPINFKFVSKNDIHDISFRRVGINAGEINRNTKFKSSQTHYFIKFDSTLSDELFQRLKKINYQCKHNTCGPKSISKQELIKEYNKHTT